MKILDFVLDDFNKANSKLRLFETTSDIGSGPEEDIKKRKRIPPRRLSYGTSDEEEDENIRLPRPPKLNINLKGRFVLLKFIVNYIRLCYTLLLLFQIHL